VIAGIVLPDLAERGVEFFLRGHISEWVIQSGSESVLICAKDAPNVPMLPK